MKNVLYLQKGIMHEIEHEKKKKKHIFHYTALKEMDAVKSIISLF
jgi:hypothetical protein